MAVTEVNEKVTSSAVEQVSSAEKHEHHHVKHEPHKGIFEAFREYPWAVVYCLYPLFTCIMWGYDGLAAAIVLSIPKWREDYGYLYQDQYVVSANWQLAFTAASMIGLFVGGLATGAVARAMGQKFCLLCGHVLTVAGVFCQWYSPGKMALFFGGKLLTGIPLGIFLTIAPTYCSEVGPPALRGALVAAVNFSIVIGQLLGYGVMRETQAMAGQNSYRVMYAVQWGFAGVGLAFLPFIPDSPFRLLARGKEDAARKSIRKLYGEATVDTRVEEIRDILTNEEAAAKQGGSYRDCFNSVNRLRTTIVLSVFFIQNMSGIGWVVGYMGYFMQLSGMQGASVFDATVGVAGVMAVGNIASWPLLEYAGRRPTIFWGLVTMTVSFLLIGVLTQFVTRNASIALAQVSFMAIWSFAYQASIGAAGYSLMAESMGTAMNGLSGAVWSFALPYCINPDEGNLGGNVAFIFMGLMVISTTFVWFYYPETKGRSFEEIDELFRRKVKPRHFHKTQLA
ncbi:General alpha-glucoside permease [Cyphellophora attinorum]|uniref:General alpha-glucoside permease n=1 Tax=Cyphellophora attinorum TaxID=1664694 RepID=A0A0N1H5J4_9EURO|nr:General alpha-glucoside permease [Phialophora attinorum]KPI37682.1 General alpha-glucoside permease [Phialophora attinorum]